MIVGHRILGQRSLSGRHFGLISHLVLNFGNGHVFLLTMPNAQEDFLHGRDAYAVRPNTHLSFPIVKLSEEFFEFGGTLVRDLVGDLSGDFLEFGGFGKALFQETINLVRICVWSLSQNKIVANPISILEKQAGSTTLHIAFSQDAYAIAQNVCFVHVVRRQDHNPILLILLEHLPEATPRCRVHPTGRLIKHHDFRVAD